MKVIIPNLNQQIQDSHIHNTRKYATREQDYYSLSSAVSYQSPSELKGFIRAQQSLKMDLRQNFSYQNDEILDDITS